MYTIDEIEQREYEHDHFLPFITEMVGYGYNSFHPATNKCSCGDSIFIRTIKKEIEIKMSLSDEKIEDIEVFKEIFCHEAKLIVNMTDEDIIKRRYKLEGIVRNFRTRISKDNDEIAHRKSSKTKAERDDLERFDRDYKVKPVIVEEKKDKKSPFEKATGRIPKDKKEKAIATLMDSMGLTYDAAVKFVG